MRVITGNTYTRVVDATPKELDWLDDQLSFDDESQAFINVGGRIRRRVAPKIKLYNVISQTFPTGLVPLLQKEAEKKDIAIAVTRGEKKIPIQKVDVSWLRDYQFEAFKDALRKRRGILWLPTGAGKTEIAIALAKTVDTHWLFAVGKKDLLHQSAKRFEKRLDIDVGIIGDGKMKPDPNKRVTVATFQTLARNKDPKFFEQFGGLMVDECHTLPANSFWNVAMQLTNAYFRFGFSGTPLSRGDKKGIYTIAALGAVAHRIVPETLIEAGVLARPTIYMQKLEQDCNRATWQGVYGELITRSRTRNKLITEFARKADKPCLLFVKEIKHGHLLEKRLRNAGISCEFTFGNKDTAQRQNAVSRLVKGDIDVLIASVIFQEGIDVPEIRSVIIASAGKSVIAAVQRVGRGMRMSEGKNTFEVFDVMDTGHRTTTKWAKARKKAYLAEGYKIVEL